MINVDKPGITELYVPRSDAGVGAQWNTNTVYNRGYQSGYTDGFEDGKEQGEGGYESGYTDGYESGYTDGRTGVQLVPGYGYYTRNGSYTLTPPQGKDGFFRVTINVNIAPPDPNYFTIIPLDPSDYWRIHLENNYLYQSEVYYREDGGGWQRWNGQRDFSGEVHYVQFKGNLPTLENSVITADVEYEVYGNIMSLLAFPALDPDYTPRRCFYRCFSIQGLGDRKLKYADRLLLPGATTNSCYEEMFLNDAKLLTAPKLPATALTQNCYLGMFRGCEQLGDFSPSREMEIDLPATVLADSCYKEMFQGCCLRDQTIKLPASRIYGYEYWDMLTDTQIGAVEINGKIPSNLGINYRWLPEREGMFYVSTDELEEYYTTNRTACGIPDGWEIMV